MSVNDSIEELEFKIKQEIKSVLRGEHKRNLNRWCNELVSLGGSLDGVIVDWMGASYKTVMVEGKPKIEAVKKRTLASTNSPVPPKRTSMQELQAKLGKLPQPPQRDSGTKQYG